VTAAARPRLTVASIVDAALVVVDQEGVDGLTTTRVARELGVSQPSLYSHVTGLDEIRTAAALRCAEAITVRVRDAVQGLDGDDALLAMARTYRDYVRENPERYLLALSSAHTDEYRTLTEHYAEAVRDVLRWYGLTEAEVVEAHLAFRATVHGFVHLEARDALPVRGARPDEHFDFLIRLFAAGLRNLSAPRGAPPGSAPSGSA
jgi:AcrR family transcriptional regulator